MRTNSDINAGDNAAAITANISAFIFHAFIFGVTLHHSTSSCFLKKRPLGITDRFSRHGRHLCKFKTVSKKAQKQRC